MADARDRQIQGLSVLVNLEKRARHAEDTDVLGFILVNETHELFAYRQAVLWRRGRGRGRVRAVSALARVERDAPFVVWLERAHAALDTATPDDATEPRAVTADDLPADLAGQWADWLPPHGLWLPLAAPGGGRLGALLLARDEPWTEGEKHLAGLLADSYAHAWATLLGRRRGRPAPRRFRGGVVLPLVVAAIIGASFIIPVPLSVLAPAEVTPRDPWVVRAPLKGVVETIDVAPNERVAKGDRLLALEDTRLRNKLAVARREHAVARAEYQRAAQQAVGSRKSKARLAVLKARMKRKQAEEEYLAARLDRVTVTAPRDGLAIYTSRSEWIGKPVKTGQKIMTLADPDKGEVIIRLPVQDAIVLEKGARVQLFLAIRPRNPVSATLERAAFKARKSPTGKMVYRLTARFPEGVAPPRIGLKGTAKIYGETVSLFYYVMRRPLAAVRQWLGV